MEMSNNPEQIDSKNQVGNQVEHKLGDQYDIANDSKGVTLKVVRLNLDSCIAFAINHMECVAIQEKSNLVYVDKNGEQ